MLHFLYTNCFLNDTIGVFHCPDFMVSQLVPEMSFWLAKSRKNLNFSRCIQVSDLVLKCCSDLKRRKCIHFFLIHCFGESIVLMNGLSFFFIFESGSRLRLPRVAFLLKGLQLRSTTGSITIGLIFSFSVGLCLVSLFSYLQGPKVAENAHMMCSFVIMNFFP